MENIPVFAIVLPVHVAAAIVSPMLFTARAWRSWHGRDPAQGLLRWLPHTVDTVLFGAGLALAAMLRQSPLEHSWLAAKLVALLCYIVAGHVAVRRAQRRASILCAWLLAMAIITYIYAVALTMQANPLN